MTQMYEDEALVHLMKEAVRLRGDVEYWRDRIAPLKQAELEKLRAEIERLRLTPEQAYLQIVEGWLRDNRGIDFTEGAVDDLCKRIARALEAKP